MGRPRRAAAVCLAVAAFLLTCWLRAPRLHRASTGVVGLVPQEAGSADETGLQMPRHGQRQIRPVRTAGPRETKERAELAPLPQRHQGAAGQSREQRADGAVARRDSESEQKAWEAVASSASGYHGELGVPVVVFAGVRHQYLAETMRSLDTSRRMCIVSFNSREEGQLQDSLAVLATVRNLEVRTLRVQPAAYGLTGHAYMKLVWLETVRAAFRAVRPYEGDVVFLEDDLQVAPDFWPVLDGAARFKRLGSVTAVFAMGGWGGHNLVSADPQTFVLKTSRAFPTMGYGFNRSLAREIEAVSVEIRGEQRFPDWSDAACHWLRLRYERTNRSELRSFASPRAMELVQPTLSRVWHIGQRSSIGEDGDWEVAHNPPWQGRSLSNFSWTMKPGLHDYHGVFCPPGSKCKEGHVIHVDSRGPVNSKATSPASLLAFFFLHESSFRVLAILALLCVVVGCVALVAVAADRLCAGPRVSRIADTLQDRIVASRVK